ncbi:hypothetical protein KVR01_002718 [Diaporthe batatas]|uniref:uncharacterized protein n=1 Tax=Diaporthe batatas TaxID=748121 RepID=UPI001D04B773|nr:uncharacterized protein KVR01_002718 [Diaporthe batatas]KAG8167029.1 hypothetical protein KVR01_002718 [Diaporthe batatas]
MAPRMFISGLLATAGLVLPAVAQLSGTVGPTTSTAAKQHKICNIMDYGGKADAKADNGPAIAAAWKDCAKGGEVLIPEGDYGMATWVKLVGGKGTSINLEGTIYRTGRDEGNMFMIEHSTDFEFYSATSKGAIQGYGYEFHKEGKLGARLLRLWDVQDFSVHDVILVDAPQFHLSIDTCSNGEVYNMIIHGGYQGGLDGIDVWGSNIWIHDIEVSNKDECVTVKDPSDHLLIEQVHCNWSGGCAMGSLATDINIHDIEYNHIYTHHSNQMYMIKSNGGTGTVSNLAFNNFTGHSNAYTLDFDTAWGSMKKVAGDGISYSNISFSGWRGTCADGTQRGPIKMNCPAAVPCTGITVDDFSVWTEKGKQVLHGCQNAYGEGACLKPGGGATPAYTSTRTVTASGDAAYETMANELAAGWDAKSPIPIPTMPASFYPGRQPISAILGGGGGGGGGSRAGSKGKAAVPAKVPAPLPTGGAGAGGDGSGVPSATGFVTRKSSAAAPQPTDGGRGEQGQGRGSHGGGCHKA